MLTKESIKYMKRNGDQGGNILHFVSSSSKDVSHNKAPYGIAKAGLEALISILHMKLQNTKSRLMVYRLLMFLLKDMRKK